MASASAMDLEVLLERERTVLGDMDPAGSEKRLELAKKEFVMSAPQRKTRARLKRRHPTALRRLKKLQDTVTETVKSLILTAEDLDKIDRYLATSMEALRLSDDECMIRDALVVMHDGWEKLLDASRYLNRAIDALDPDGAEARLQARRQAG